MMMMMQIIPLSQQLANMYGPRFHVKVYITLKTLNAILGFMF